MEEKRQQSLLCFENLDRKSPELWPERVPGAWEFAKQSTVITGGGQTSKSVKFKVELDGDDARLVNELGQLSADQLMEHIKNVQNSAYQLGVEEAKQLAKGKFLKVFEKQSGRT